MNSKLQLSNVPMVSVHGSTPVRVLCRVLDVAHISPYIYLLAWNFLHERFSFFLLNRSSQRSRGMYLLGIGIQRTPARRRASRRAGYAHNATSRPVMMGGQLCGDIEHAIIPEFFVLEVISLRMSNFTSFILMFRYCVLMSMTWKVNYNKSIDTSKVISFN